MLFPVSRCHRAWLALPACLAAGLAALPAVGAGPVTRTLPPAVAMRQLSRQSMSFERNTGRFDPRVRFVARSGGATLFLTDSNATMVLPGKPKGDLEAAMRDDKRTERGPGHVLRMKLVGAHTPSSVTGLEKQSRIVNYFIGKDRSKWRTHVPTFGRARFAGVYPGTDLVYYGNSGRMEYDFVVKPGADPGKIRLAFEGTDDLRIAANGDLLARTPVGDVQLQRPYAYQTVGGRRVQVACGYSLAPGSRQVAFRTARYDASKPLVVDPSVTFCSYAGGSGNDYMNAVAISSTNAVIAAGYSASINYPVTAGALYSAYGGSTYDAVVTGLRSDGTGLFSTYLGGAGIDQAYRIALDSSDAIYICGQTGSAGFPATAGAYQTAMRGTSDWFVTKLSADGSALVYSTYLGGTAAEEWSNTAGDGGLAVNSYGEAAVALPTYSIDFPTTAGAVQSAKANGTDCAIARLNSAGSAILASTYYGGNGTEVPFALALGPDDDVYVGGYTAAPDFPVSSGAFQSSKVGTLAGFVARLSSDLTTRRYSTCFESPTASTSSRVTAILPNADGSAYIGGFCGAGFPTTPGAFQAVAASNFSGVAAKLKGDGTGLDYATGIATSSNTYVYGLARLATGDLLVVGVAGGPGLPTSSYAIRQMPSSYDGYLAILDAGLSTAGYVTYFGGAFGDYPVAAALRGSTLAMAGYTAGSLPVTAGVFQATRGGGGYDGFMAALSVAASVGTLTVADGSGDRGASVSLTATLTSASVGVSGMSVAFTVDGTSAGSATTNSSGVATLSYTIPADKPGGNYTIGAASESQTYLAGATATGTLTVAKQTTSLAVAMPEAAAGSYSTITATLTAGGSGISGKTVSLGFNGTGVGTATTGSDGVASLRILVPSATTTGSKAIGASFDGDTGYTAGSATGTVVINAAQTCGITCSATEWASSVTAHPYAYLYAPPKPYTMVAGKTLHFTVDGVEKGTAVTDASGYAAAAITGLGVGAWPLVVTFDGDATYAAASWTTTVTVNAGTGVTIYAGDQPGASPGVTVPLYAYIKNATTGALLPGCKVEFLVDSSLVGSGTSDSTGYAQVSYPVPAGATAGKHTITARHPADATYALGSNTGTLTVSAKDTTAMFVNDFHVAVGAQVKLYAYIWKRHGKVMASGKTVQFKINGNVVGSAVSNSTGYAQIIYTVQAGDTTILAEFAGDATSTASSATGTITNP